MPLERALGTIAGVSEMTSRSTTGQTRITLQFDLSRDINSAATDVQGAINAARAMMPSGLRSNPSYNKANPASAPIITLALTSDSLSQGQLYDIASTTVQQKLAQVEGVGEVQIGGSTLPAVRIDLDPDALAQAGAPAMTWQRAAVSGTDATYVQDGASKYPRPVRVRLPAQEQSSIESLLAIKVRGGQGQLVALSELVNVQRGPWDGAIHHKDGLPVAANASRCSSRIAH